MTIGFGDFQNAWQGPVYLELARYSTHARTVRYRCQLETRSFDLYAPRFMLDALAPEEIPAKLVVAIGKAPERLRKIGFSSAPYQPQISSEVCEFSFAVEKVNSMRYDLVHNGQTYALYVPKEIFGNEPRPKCVYLRIGVPPTAEA